MEYSQENNLERTLRLANEDADNQIEFIQALLTSNVFIPGKEIERGQEAALQIREDKPIQVKFWETDQGIKYVPAFTSSRVLSQLIGEDSPFIEINALQLFDIINGNNICLNPKSECYMFLGIDVIQHLLNQAESYTQHESAHIESEVKFFSPEPYPIDVAETLTKLFSKNSKVNSAFLVGIEYASQDNGPRLMIAIEVTEDYEQISKIAGPLAAKSAPPNTVVDFYQLGPQSIGYFNENFTPFYLKKRDYKGEN